MRYIALEVECPHCSAEPGDPCMTSGDRKADVPHTKRTKWGWQVWREKRLQKAIEAKLQREEERFRRGGGTLHEQSLVRE